MEKVTGYTNLYRRGATYYFRARVPLDIVDSYGKEEEKFSLKTKDKGEAVTRLRKAAREVDLKFISYRKELGRCSRPEQDNISTSQLQQIYDVYYQHLLDEDEETRLSGFYRGTQKEKPAPTFDEYVSYIAALSSVTRTDYAQGDAEVFFLGEAEEVLSWDNVDLKLAPDSMVMRRVARKLQEATLHAYESIQERNKGSVVDTPVVPQKSLSDSPVESDAALLSEVMEKWITEKSRLKWTEKTAQDNRRWVLAFISLCGDRPLDRYSKSDAVAFKELLLQLPPNSSKKAVLKGLDVAQAAVRAQDLGMEPMSAKNARKAFQYVGSLWRWSFAHYDEVEKNIFEGLTVEVNSDKRKERDKFTIDDLNTIFQSPVYTGCVSAAKWNLAGSYSMKGTAKFWVPLIALYSGARLGEVLQLYVSDICEEDGIFYFDINEDGEDKRLKTRTSERKVPIHQILVGYGFLDYVVALNRQGEKRVFPDVSLSVSGSYSDFFSRYFSRFLTGLEVKTSKKSFHSFRHNFKDACRECGAENVMDALQGHSEQGMSGRYGSGYSLKKLNEGLQKVGYSGLELSNG